MAMRTAELSATPEMMVFSVLTLGLVDWCQDLCSGQHEVLAGSWGLCFAAVAGNSAYGALPLLPKPLLYFTAQPVGLWRNQRGCTCIRHGSHQAYQCFSFGFTFKLSGSYSHICMLLVIW